MGLDKIKEDILEKIKKDTASAMRDAKKQIAVIEEDTESKIKDMEAKAKKKLDTELDLIKKREKSAIEALTKKKIILGEKEALADCYTAAYAKIAKQTGAERKKIVERLLKRASKQINVYYVHANKNDKSAMPSKVEYKSSDISGGVVCETKDRSLLVNYSYEVLFKEVQEETMQRTAEILFE